jgi:hypothetical protein
MLKIYFFYKVAGKKMDKTKTDDKRKHTVTILIKAQKLLGFLRKKPPNKE